MLSYILHVGTLPEYASLALRTDAVTLSAMCRRTLHRVMGSTQGLLHRALPQVLRNDCGGMCPHLPENLDYAGWSRVGSTPWVIGRGGRIQVMRAAATDECDSRDARLDKIM